MHWLWATRGGHDLSHGMTIATMQPRACIGGCYLSQHGSINKDTLTLATHSGRLNTIRPTGSSTDSTIKTHPWLDGTKMERNHRHHWQGLISHGNKVLGMLKSNMPHPSIPHFLNICQSADPIQGSANISLEYGEPLTLQIAGLLGPGYPTF